VTDNTTDLQLIEGIRVTDTVVLQHLAKEIRPQVVRAVTNAGGNQADGKQFFTAALVDAFGMIQRDAWPADTTIEAGLSALAVAHFKSWLVERGIHTAAPPPDEEGSTLPKWTSIDSYSEPDTAVEMPAASPAAPAAWLPGDEALLKTRHAIFTWKAAEKLTNSERTALQDAPDNLTNLNVLYQQLSQRLSKPIDPISPPAWIEWALHDRAGWDFWRVWNTEDNRQEVAQDNASANSVVKYAFFGLLFATLGFALYAWFNRAKPVEKSVFEQNYQRPESLWADMKARYSDSTLTARPSACAEAFQTADELYQQGEWPQVARVLMEVIENPSLTDCHSDARYFIGVMHIESGNPDIGLYMLSSIEDLEAYGEDLYWYQTLAFVKIANNDPEARPQAKRAIERFLQQTRDSVRMARAQKMLDEVGVE
jgi:hypothetical protein